MKSIEIPRRMQVIQDYRKQGGSVGAVFPIHYPRELLRAFDILPVEVWGPPGIGTGRGAAHLQPYVCSIVQNALSFIQSSSLDIVDLLLLPHACDSLQGLGSLLIDFIQQRQSVLTLYLPRGRRVSDLNFLTEELQALYHRLNEITGRSPTDADLADCIGREQDADALLAELHHDRKSLPLTDQEFYHLIRSREYLPAESFSQIAQEVLKGMPLSPSRASDPHAQGGGVSAGQKREQAGGCPGTPILLSGILPEPMGLFTALAELGGCVVADDLACCGRRLYPPGRSSEPLRCMAERIQGGPPDPTRGDPIQERLAHLLQQVDDSGARGVVFYDVKFCEPELFDLPLLRQGLHKAGIPSLAFELDLNDGLSQPFLNRLAAFLEMIQ